MTDPVPLTPEEIDHFDEQLSYCNDTVVRCLTCGRTQYLKLQYGIENGWSECHGSVMPIIYHRKSGQDEDKELDIIRQNIVRKYFYKKAKK